jgi:hypothetical protein
MKLFIGLFLLLLTQASSAQNGVGNGGDLLRKIFRDGQALAFDKTSKLNACSFEPKTDPQVASWILSHRHELAQDLRYSKVYWVEESKPTCAWTQPFMYSNILLSFPACGRTVLKPENAAWLLIHESTHHLGFTDEIFPEKVAQAVMSSQTISRCQAPVQPGNPMIVNTQEINGDPFYNNFLFEGNRMVGVSLDANVNTRALQNFKLTESGVVRADVVPKLHSSSIITLINGSIVGTLGAPNLYNQLGVNFYTLYGYVNHGYLKIKQLIFDPRGFLFALASYTSPQSNGESGSYVQIVKAQGALNTWEQTLENEKLLTPLKNTTPDPRSQINVKGNYLVLNDPRARDGNGPGASGPFIEIFNIHDPYAPVRTARISTKAEGNDLNRWVPVMSTEILYVPAKNTVTAYSLATGKEVGNIILPEEFRKGDHASFLYDRTLYVATQFNVYALDVSNPTRIKVAWRLRVANSESQGISYLYRFGNHLYVTWKGKNVGSDYRGGLFITTLSLPQ